MRLPDPASAYDPARERQRNVVLEQADQQNRKRGQDLELGEGERIVLTAPDGGRWALTVNNDGTLATSAL